MSTLTSLTPSDSERPNKRIDWLVLSDFDLHHPAWRGKNAESDPEADFLLTLADDANLDLWLARTRHHHLEVSRIADYNKPGLQHPRTYKLHDCV